MDIRDLKYFEVIAEANTLGEAAKKLYRTQPALTQCIRRLEEELGSALFERAGRKIDLTPMGALLQKKAKDLRQAHEAAFRELQDYVQGFSGHIRLGCTPTMSLNLIPEVIKKLLVLAPDLTMDLSIGTSDGMLQKLRNDGIDLLITPASPAGSDIESTPVMQDKMVVAASRNHPLFTKRYTIQDLARYRWVLIKGASYNRQWLINTLVGHGCPPPAVQVEVDMILQIKRLIYDTQLLCFFSRQNLQDDNQLREIEIPEMTMLRTISLVWRKGGYLPPLTARLADLFAATAGQYS